MHFLRVTTLWIATACFALGSASAADTRKSPTRPAAEPANAPAGAYKGAIVMDAATGSVIFEQNADVVNPPASMTKLMTFAVLYDRLAAGTLTLSTPVTVTAPDTKIGGTQVWLKEKETFTVEELIYAMMIQSANDCAYALGRTAAGSSEAFVELMNEKARALGMRNTTFRTAHGLPPNSRRISDGDLSSPRDFAILSRHLLAKTDVLKYAAVAHRKFGEGIRSPDKVIAMDNHNHLLGKVAGVDGLKTGFTNAAGFCLAATAVRNGRRVIVVTMGGTDKKARDLGVASLLERGFAAIPASSVAAPPAPAGPSPFTPAPAKPTTPAASSTTSGDTPSLKLNLPKK